MHKLYQLCSLSSSAIIGSPIVSLSSNGAAIEVTIKDPVFTISALRKVYHSVNYNITYWEDGWREKVGLLGLIKCCSYQWFSCNYGYCVGYWEEQALINHRVWGSNSYLVIQCISGDRYTLCPKHSIETSKSNSIYVHIYNNHSTSSSSVAIFSKHLYPGLSIKPCCEVNFPR